MGNDELITDFLNFGLKTVEAASIIGFFLPPFYLVCSYFDVFSRTWLYMFPLHISRALLCVCFIAISEFHQIGNAGYVNICLFMEILQVVLGFFALPLLYLHASTKRTTMN